MKLKWDADSTGKAIDLEDDDVNMIRELFNCDVNSDNDSSSDSDDSEITNTSEDTHIV